MADKPGYATDETEGHNIQQISEPLCHLRLPLQLLPENFKFRITGWQKVPQLQKHRHFMYFILIVTTVHWRSLFTVRGILFEQNFCFSSSVGKEHEAHFLARLLLLLKLLHAKCHVIDEHCMWHSNSSWWHIKRRAWMCLPIQH